MTTELFRLAAGEGRVAFVATLTEPDGNPAIGAPPGYFDAALELRTEGAIVTAQTYHYRGRELTTLADDLATIEGGRRGSVTVHNVAEEVLFLRGEAPPAKEPARLSFWSRWQHPKDEADAAELGPDDVVVTITHGEIEGAPRVTFFLDDGIDGLRQAAAAMRDTLARSAWCQESISIHAPLA